MDYEKAYKEVLNSAKKVLLDCTSDERNVVEYIFPELRESADEEIRKALIEYYSFNEAGHSHALDNITPEQIVDWLEKQSDSVEINPDEIIEECHQDNADHIIDIVTEQRNPSEWSEEDETYLSHVITAIKLYYTDDKECENPWREELLRWLKSIKSHKQGKQNPIDYEEIRKDIIALIEWSKSYAASGITTDEANEMLAWLEKIGKHLKFCKTIQTGDRVTRNEDGVLVNMSQLDRIAKPRKIQSDLISCDKVEPKFHEGDWIISKYMHLVMQILNNDNGSYKTVEIDGTERNDSYDFIERNFKLWTITDAQDGDIIYAESKFVTFDFIYIFSEIKNENSWAYCSVDSDCDDLYGESRHWCFDNCKGSIELDRYNFYPATKEQRDILFAKMKEEGYGWNSDNKELKDINQSPTDMAKSEFHKGDWITFYGGEPFKILKVEPELNGVLNYLLLNQNGHDSYYNKKYVDENTRLWTIQDAKPGNVLVSSDNKPFIYNGYFNETFVGAHCGIDIYNEFIITDEQCDWTINSYIRPANKEQCDILFQKMTDEGYAWDNKKKELIKL